MRNSVLIFFIVFFSILSCTKYNLLQDKILDDNKNKNNTSSDVFTDNTVYVKFDRDFIEKNQALLDSNKVQTRSSAFSQANNELGIVSLKRMYPYSPRWEKRHIKAGLDRWYIVEFDKNRPVTRAKSLFSQIDGVEDVCPKYPIINNSFNDTFLKYQWGLINPKYKNVDINVAKVWKNYKTGDTNVVVAILDTGIDLYHDDLIGNVIPAGPNGSWNFVTHDDDIQAGEHGTHVAGVIAAVNNNKRGICGIAGGDKKKNQPGVRLLSCLVQDYKYPGVRMPMNGGHAEAMVYAADNGALICQNSWGVNPDTDGDGIISKSELADYIRLFRNPPKYLKDAIDYFVDNAGCDDDGNQLPGSYMKGGLVVFAAGNDNIRYGVPSGYDRVIAVGAIDPDGSKADYSDWGDWVDICAPGTKIFSTIPNDKYTFLSGTSMACPQVSGVAALVLSNLGGKGFTNDMLRECIINGANYNAKSKDSKIGPLLDAYGAITYAEKSLPPSPKFTYVNESNWIDFSWNQTRSPKGKASYFYYVVLSKNRHDLEKIDLDNILDNKSLIVKKIEADNDQKKFDYTLGDLEFNSVYYCTIIATDYHSKTGGGNQISKITTKQYVPPYWKKDLINRLLGQMNSDFQFSLLDYVENPQRISNLDCTVSSSNQKFASASYINGIIYVKTRGYGYATIDVDITDNYGSKLHSSFQVVRYADDKSYLLTTDESLGKWMLRTGENDSKTSVDLYNVYGSKVYSISNISSAFNPLEFSLSSLPPGIYQVVITINDNTFNDSIVIF